MNIPSLPTDNLYKFVAISGVLLGLICLVLLELRISKQYELDNAVTLGKEALGYITKDFERVGDKNRDLVNKIEEVQKSNDAEKLELLLSELSIIRDEYKSIKKRVPYFDEEIIKLRRISETAEVHYQRTQRIFLFLSYGIAFGFCFAGYGFFMWYHRLQKYQDILIRSEASKLTEEIPKSEENSESEKPRHGSP